MGRHLAAPGSAILKYDRDLADAKSTQQRPVGELDLERVSLRAHGLELDPFQHLAAKALEATGEVTGIDPEDGAGVQATAAADQPSQHSPVAHAAPRDITRAEDQVGVG